MTESQIESTQPAASAAPGESPESDAQAAGPRENQIVPGTVVEVGPGFVVVDIGVGQGRIPLEDFALVDGKRAVAAGDRFDVLFELRDDAGKLVLSKDKAEKLQRFASVMGACERGERLRGEVVAHVAGGYSVDVGMRAFLPEKHADVGQPEALPGQTLEFNVLKFDKRKGDIVLSRRELQKAAREAGKQELLGRLHEGAILAGQVKSVTDFGVFVDVGGLDGLVHVSELGYGRAAHPRNLLKPGAAVQVKVLKFDAAAGKLSLSIKQTLQDPWAGAAAAFTPGARVRGKVVSLADFGVFVELQPGVEGLVHISEISWTRRIAHPSKVFAVGDEVEAVVLEVDAKARRISLSIRRTEESPWTKLEEQYPIGSVIRSRITNVTEIGVFVAVVEGIDGLVHVSELSWTQRIKNPGDLYKKGDEVEAMVLSIDVENERFALGIKQLRPDPWTVLADKFPEGSKLTGKVTRLADFGAFVEVEPGIEGLVHVSEMREERVENPRDVVKEGDVIEVQVLEVDPYARKVSLSMRALLRDNGDYREFMNRDVGKASLGEVFGPKAGKKP